jgi:hypothetical protein
MRKRIGRKLKKKIEVKRKERKAPRTSRGKHDKAQLSAFPFNLQSGEVVE